MALRGLQSLFAKYPLTGNCVIFGSLHVAAEFSQQTFIKTIFKDPKKPAPPYDWVAVRNYGLVSTFAMAPVLYYWYGWLDRKYVGKTVPIIVKKVLIGQLMMTPVILSIFFTGMSILEGRRDIFEDVRVKLWPTYKASCFFWFPANTINFAIMPPEYRVVYMAVAAFAWTNILCVFKRDPHEEVV